MIGICSGLHQTNPLTLIPSTPTLTIECPREDLGLGFRVFGVQGLGFLGFRVGL